MSGVSSPGRAVRPYVSLCGFTCEVRSRWRSPRVRISCAHSAHSCCTGDDGSVSIAVQAWLLDSGRVLTSTFGTLSSLRHIHPHISQTAPPATIRTFVTPHSQRRLERGVPVKECKLLAVILVLLTPAPSWSTGPVEAQEGRVGPVDHPAKVIDVLGRERLHGRAPAHLGRRALSRGRGVLVGQRRRVRVGARRRARRLRRRQLRLALRPPED